MRDITSFDDTKLFVDTFYDKVREDQLLAPVFKLRIPSDEEWPKHLDVLYKFWNTVLFATRDYQGSPFPKHIGLPIEKQHFDRWISLFNSTIDELFIGPKAREAKTRASTISFLFQSKLNNNDSKNIIHLA